MYSLEVAMRYLRPPSIIFLLLLVLFLTVSSVTPAPAFAPPPESLSTPPLSASLIVYLTPGSRPDKDWQAVYVSVPYNRADGNEGSIKDMGLALAAGWFQYPTIGQMGMKAKAQARP